MAKERESSPFSPDDLAKFLLLSPNLLAIVDAGGQLVRVNSAFGQVLGWQSADLLDSPFLDLLQGDAGRQAVERLRRYQELIASTPKKKARGGLTSPRRFLCLEGGVRR